MSDVFRTGSRDEVNPCWDADCEPEHDHDQHPCDAGLPGCMGEGTRTVHVPYLADPLILCDACVMSEMHERAQQFVIDAFQQVRR